MFVSCEKVWFNIFVKQNRNIFGFSHTLDSEVSTNKQNWNEKYHWQSHQVLGFFTFLGIWPTVLAAAFYRLFDRPKGTAWEAIVFSFRILIFFLISKRNGENDWKLSCPSINPFAVRPRIWQPRTSKSTECHLFLIQNGPKLNNRPVNCSQLYGI